MKTEIRTYEKKIYIAEDGKEFENRDDCFIYEHTYSIFAYVDFYNDEGEKMLFNSKTKLNDEDIFIAYIHVKDFIPSEIQKFFIYKGLYIPSQIGWYLRRTDEYESNEWILFDLMTICKLKEDS